LRFQWRRLSYPQNAPGGDDGIKAEGEREGKKGKIGNGRDQAVEMRVVFAPP